MKTIGQVCYEAFKAQDDKLHPGDAPMADWSWLDAETCEKWERAAGAVWSRAFDQGREAGYDAGHSKGWDEGLASDQGEL